MRRKTTLLNVAAVVLATAFIASGCTTDAPPPEAGIHYSSSEAALRAHERKQRLRAERGGYKRLYRPSDCRRPVRGNCSGFPTYNPS